MLSLRSLYSHHAALSLDKQLALGNIIEGHDFNLDFDTGTLNFGPDLSFAMQLLGSVSRQSNTWLWSWASSQPMPEQLLQAAYQMQELGEEQEIPEIYEGGFDVVEPFNPFDMRAMMKRGLSPSAEPQPDPIDGHYVAMVSAGVCKANAYYGADYGRGVAYVLLPQVPGLDEFCTDEPAHMAGIFTQLLQLPYPLDQRVAFGAYLEQKGYQVEQNGLQVRGTKNSNTLAATFDSEDRLTLLEANGEFVATE